MKRFLAIILLLLSIPIILHLFLYLTVMRTILDKKELGLRMRGLLRRRCRLLVHLCKVTGVIKFDLPKELGKGAIYIANHRTLIDALVIMSILEDGLCIAKPALRRLPIIGAILEDSQFPIGGLGGETVTQSIARIKDGCSLLLFPEGTRVPGDVIGEFERGVGYIIQGTEAPISGLFIEASPPFLDRESGFLQFPVKGTSLSIQSWGILRESLEIEALDGDPRAKAKGVSAQLHSYFSRKIAN